MRLTVCGTKPNPSLWAPGRTPLVDSRSEKRLVELAEVSLETWRTAVRYDNLYASPDDVVKLMPREEVRRVLNAARSFGHAEVIFLGSPARATVRGAAWHTWYGTGEIDIAFSPHPSGLNRWWNDPHNTREARDFWRKVGEEL
jgi:hypothetical protein